MKKLLKTLLEYGLYLSLCMGTGVMTGLLTDWLLYDGDGIKKVVSAVKSIKNKIW